MKALTRSVIRVDPLEVHPGLPTSRLREGWSDSKPSLKRIRAARAAQPDFARLAYIGVTADTALQRLKRQPNRTAIDDIWDAIQAHDPRPLLLGIRS
jgi:hypothetical protein